MAVLKGISRTRFASFEDPNSGIGRLLNRGQDALKGFVEQSNQLFKNSYVEDGAEAVPAFSFLDPSFAGIKKPTNRKVITQKPKATVFIKKRMFDSLRGNFDIDFMDEEEKLFLRAAKLLMQRKCNEIAFYENLISLEGMLDSNGFLEIDAFLDQYLDNFFRVLELGFGVGELVGLDDLESAVESIVASIAPTTGGEFVASSYEIVKKLISLYRINRESRANKFTTWIVDPTNFDFGNLGPGVGVIELNLITRLATNCGISTGSGNCSMTIVDPYRLLMVSESDIEIAMREAASFTSSASQVMAAAGNLLLRQAEILDQEINRSRRERGLSEINFEVQFNNQPAQAVLVETQEFFNASTVNEITSEQALNPVERAKAIQVLSALDSYRSQQANALENLKFVGKDLSSLRKKMRKEFLGQPIIQHMDAIHVFINSDTRFDTTNYSNNPREKLKSLENELDSISAKAIFEEWEVIAKGAIPFALYQLIRRPDVFRGDGVSVFAGLVNDVGMSYTAQDGKFSISIVAADNTHYLTLTRINTAPSAKQSEGILNDPLTPFDLQVDPSSGLLTEAPELSSENKSRLGLIRFDEGPEAGRLIRSGKKIWVDKEKVGDQTVYSFQHTPGLIYKWKEGIISASLRVNDRARPDGRGSGLVDLQNFYGLSVETDPFAGLDSADIVSILVTGQPYNYASFLQNSLGAGNFSKNNNSQFYFNFLFDFLERQRPSYGGFIPAKSAVIDPRKVLQAFDSKRNLEAKFQTLAALQKDIARLQDLLDKSSSQLEKSNTLLESITTDQVLDVEDTRTQELADREADTQRTIAIAQQTIANVEGQLSRQQSKLIKLSSEITELKDSENLSGLDENIKINIAGNQAHIDLSNELVERYNRKLNYQVKRKPEEVRFNKDQNYLIVSDKYDYDTDIQAFVRNLKSTPAEVFGAQSSDYKSPLVKCSEVAERIDFEFFADPDGNLVFRPPEYNKTPLSLLVKMLRLDSGDGSNIAPDFLKNLFLSRLELVKEEIVDKDLALKEKAILGGFNLNTFGVNLVISNDSKATTVKDGIIIDAALKKEAQKAINPENVPILTDYYSEATGDLTQEQLSNSILPRENGSDLATAGAYDLVRTRKQIGARTGNSRFLDLDENNESDIEAAERELDDFDSNFKRVGLINEISQIISQRQLLLKAYTKLADKTRNYTEFVDGDNEQFQNRDMYQDLLSWSLDLGSNAVTLPKMPTYLKELIENDLSNDEGWRSGKRFIIYDDVITDMSLSIKAPEFTQINVTGAFNYVRPETKVPEFLWAGATDFDSWRQFGFRSSQQKTRNDMVNPEAQLAPYAVFKLLRERAKIHSGSITVVGNEFYRPGDVVYINNKSMLYYVENVNHDFTFPGAVFRTKLTLSHGHVLGDYIPTPLDVIGKGVLNSKKNAYGTIKSIRNATPSDNNVVSLGTLFAPSYNLLNEEGNSEKYRKEFFSANEDVVKRILSAATAKLNSTSDRSIGKIEIRSYFINQEDEVSANRLRSSASLIANWTKELLTVGFGNEVPIRDSDATEIETLNAEDVKDVYIIDIASDLSRDDKKYRRFPSRRAWSGAGSSGVFNPKTDAPIPAPLHAVDVVFVVKRKTNSDNN